MSLRYLLDEDLPPEAARVCRNLGIDAVSVHEIERTGMTDHEQLRHSAAERRVFVTRNRDDFIMLTIEFHRAGEGHPGLLIAGRSLPNDRPELIAHAMRRWHDIRSEHPETFGPYVVDFLSGEKIG